VGLDDDVDDDVLAVGVCGSGDETDQLTGHRVVQDVSGTNHRGLLDSGSACGGSESRPDRAALRRPRQLFPVRRRRETRLLLEDDRATSMSSSRTTTCGEARATVSPVRSRITSLLGRYVVDAAVCVLAVIVVIEDLVSPTATLADHRYDRGPEIVIIPVTVIAAALMLARRRIGIAAPMIAMALFGASSFPAKAWLPSSG